MLFIMVSEKERNSFSNFLFHKQVEGFSVSWQFILTKKKFNNMKNELIKNSLITLSNWLKILWMFKHIFRPGFYVANFSREALLRWYCINTIHLGKKRTASSKSVYWWHHLQYVINTQIFCAKIIMLQCNNKNF